jgi:uridine phosphorylase
MIDANLPHASAPFNAADVPIDDEGRIYHLQLKPGQVAPDILLVGDPGRAEFIGSKFLRDLEFEHEHRGLVTVTGTSEITDRQTTIISPLRTTVTTSGMGTPSLEIILNELVLLNEIDFETKRRKSEFPRLHIIRVGTAGGLQAGTVVGTPIITTYAIGMDSTGLYYEAPYPDEICQRLERELSEAIDQAISPDSRFSGKIHPYVARAEPRLVRALLEAAETLGVGVKAGMTVSAPGFFAPQGRETSRLKPSLPELDKLLSNFDPKVEDQHIENLEMESSFMMHFLGGLGYWGGSICPTIANRRLDTFDTHYQTSIENATRVALLALTTLRK